MASSRGSLEIAELCARVCGWRILLVNNRNTADVASQLDGALHIHCTVEDAVGHPRLRQALLERIERRTYDAVLVAQGFAQHADSSQIAAACRRTRIPYVAVGKGRYAEIILAMRTVLLRQTPAAPD